MKAASGSSLRLRLAIAGLILLGLVFVVAFFGLSLLFERHVERRVTAELERHLDQIVANLERDGEGRLALVRDPVDPRFSQPLSGLYWQIEQEGRKLRSRSLWDGELTLVPLDPGAPASLRITGPAREPLFAVEREVIAGGRLGSTPVVAAVALDAGDIDRAAADFRRDMVPYFMVFALLLIAASLIQIHVGLRPLSVLRRRIAEIRSGEAQRMGEDFPGEILPLTAEVDALLASGEDQVRRARQQAADLAHGLKTPLQALAGDVERLRAGGQAAVADEIGLSLAAMRRHVDHQLARARMSDRPQGRRAPVLRVINRLLAVMERTPRGMLLDWSIDVAERIEARIDADDLAELLGNLLDNAVRYARSQIAIEAVAKDGTIILTVCDDGPGVPDHELQNIVHRGGRLDGTSGGAGLGLAIASEIAVAAGGELKLSNAEPGLCVTLVLSAPDSQNRVA